MKERWGETLRGVELTGKPAFPQYQKDAAVERPAWEE
jgi:hypothetical protein